MRASGLILAAAALLAALSAAGCQSTQAQSAELAEQGDKLLEEGKLEIAQQSDEVELVSATVLPGDEGTSAIALELRNTSDRGLRNVPVLLDVQDAKGKSLFKNNGVGTDKTLISVPVIGPGAEVFWVHDQIFTTEKPSKVEVQIGANAEPLPAEMPAIEVSEPKLVNDPISGLEVNGTVENRTGAEQRRVYFYAVARQGDRIVAAGRGAIDKLKSEPKRAPEYHIFMIGDPKGAELSVNVMPTVLE